MGGRCAQTGHPLKLPSPTKLARLGHFPPASQAGRLAGPVFYVYVFSLVDSIRIRARETIKEEQTKTKIWMTSKNFYTNEINVFEIFRLIARLPNPLKNTFTF
jgi:hypothetical protein